VEKHSLTVKLTCGLPVPIPENVACKDKMFARPWSWQRCCDNRVQ